MHSRLMYQSDFQKELQITYIKNDAIEKIFKYVFFLFLSGCIFLNVISNSEKAKQSISILILFSLDIRSITKNVNAV